MSKSFFPFLGDFPFFYSTAISIDSRTFIKVSTIDFLGSWEMDERKLSIVQSWTKQRCSFSTTPEYLYCCAEVYYCPAPDSIPLSQASRRRAPQSRLRACIKRLMDIFLFNWSSLFSVVKRKISCSRPALPLVHESVRLVGVIFLFGTDNGEGQT